MDGIIGSDVSVRIFRFLEMDEIYSCMRTSKTWYNSVNQENLWNFLIKRDFPNVNYSDIDSVEWDKLQLDDFPQKVHKVAALLNNTSDAARNLPPRLHTLPSTLLRSISPNNNDNNNSNNNNILPVINVKSCESLLRYKKEIVFSVILKKSLDKELRDSVTCSSYEYNIAGACAFAKMKDLKLNLTNNPTRINGYFYFVDWHYYGNFSASNDGVIMLRSERSKYYPPDDDEERIINEEEEQEQEEEQQQQQQQQQQQEEYKKKLEQQQQQGQQQQQPIIKRKIEDFDRYVPFTVQFFDAGPTKAKYKGTPLHWACVTGQLEVVEYLCEHFKSTINLWSVIPAYNATPLDIAIKNRHWDIVKYLRKQMKLSEEWL